MWLQKLVVNLMSGQLDGQLGRYILKSTVRAVATAAKAPIIAISQMRATNDKAANMCQVEELVAKAKAQQATFLFLPEACDFVGETPEEITALAEPLTGPTMKQYQALARQHKIWLSLGGIHDLKCGDDSEGKIYNVHVIVDESGDVVGAYRKLHLFDVDTPEFIFRESEKVAPGKCLMPPLATPIGCVGLQICYDLRFAECSLLLKKGGAQILTYPACFSYHTGQSHWEILLRARAIENQCFVVAAAQVGYHSPEHRSWGHAMVVNPWGKVLADCGGEDDLTIATAEIDLKVIASVEEKMPCFEHRRNDVYSLTAFEQQGFLVPEQDYQFASNTICKDTIFYETQHCFAFTNLCCVVKGHVLVSTKRETPRLNGLSCDEMSDLFTTVCKVQCMLEDIYQTTSATVTVQDGPDAGQTVPHVHFHVMPRRPGDFDHNDQIYAKLEDRCQDKPNRSLQERINEAQMYRDFMKKRYEIICKI